MEIKQLKYFSEIVKYGSFNKASQAIFVSQPYLSNVVKDLEDELGAKLVKRSKKGIALTRDGEKLLVHAGKVLRDMEELKHSFSFLDNDQITISVSATDFSCVLDSFSAICRDSCQHESFTFSLKEACIGEVLEDVKNNASQIGIIYRDTYLVGGFTGYLESRRLKFYPLLSSCPCVILSRSHPLFSDGKEEIDIEQLRPFGFVSCIRKNEDFTGSLVVDSKAVLLEKWNKKVYICGMENMLTMLENTNFFSVGLNIPKLYENFDLAELNIRGCNNIVTLGYVLKDEEEISPETEAFIKILKENFNVE